MSRKNRERRAANARRKHTGQHPQQHTAHSRGGARPPRPAAAAAEPPHQRPPASVDVSDLVWAAVDASRSGGPVYAKRLGELEGHGARAQSCLDRLLRDAVANLWQRGWTPSDVLTVAGRSLTAAHAAVAAAAVAGDGAARLDRGEWLHPRWEAQLELATARAQAARDPHPRRRVALGVETLTLLAYTRAIPPTLPRPGQRPRHAVPHGLDPKVVTKVRALLAKAESTEFEAEADALTAKAQELIARHAISEALLGGASPAQGPVARRLAVEDPYADAKADLVAEVAAANRCESVYASDAGWTTVIGFDADLDAVEVLVASLLAQATAAMARHGSTRSYDGRSTTKSFRRSFLIGFSHRIGQRLRAATKGQVDAAAGDGRLLPVLASRDAAVREALHAAFPKTYARSTSVSNGHGYHAGQAAADLAHLNAAPVLTR